MQDGAMSRSVEVISRLAVSLLMCKVGDVSIMSWASAASCPVLCGLSCPSDLHHGVSVVSSSCGFLVLIIFLVRVLSVSTYQTHFWCGCYGLILLNLMQHYMK